MTEDMAEAEVATEEDTAGDTVMVMDTGRRRDIQRMVSWWDQEDQQESDGQDSLGDQDMEEDTVAVTEDKDIQVASEVDTDKVADILVASDQLDSRERMEDLAVALEDMADKVDTEDQEDTADQEDMAAKEDMEDKVVMDRVVVIQEEEEEEALEVPDSVVVQEVMEEVEVDSDLGAPEDSEPRTIMDDRPSMTTQRRRTRGEAGASRRNPIRH